MAPPISWPLKIFFCSSPEYWLHHQYSNPPFCNPSPNIGNIFSYRTRSLPSPLASTNVHETPCGLLCMKLPHYRHTSLCPPVYHFSSCLDLSIVHALKLTKSRKISKYDLITINFDTKDVRNIKYLQPSFDSDVLYMFPQCLMVILVCVAVIWMAWIRCITATLGV